MAATSICMTGDKGGTGKTTVCLVLAEWLIHQGKQVEIIDADPSQALELSLQKCAEEGYAISTDRAPYRIVDTQGASGASLAQYVMKADVIVVPFTPHIIELEVIVGWFVSVKPVIQDRVRFVPNRLSTTIEQREGLRLIENVVKEEGHGMITPGLVHRPAVYPTIFNSHNSNFYKSLKNPTAKAEIDAVCEAIIAGD